MERGGGAEGQRNSPDAEQLHIAGIAVRKFDGLGAGGSGRLALACGRAVREQQGRPGGQGGAQTA